MKCPSSWRSDTVANRLLSSDRMCRPHSRCKVIPEYMGASPEQIKDVQMRMGKGVAVSWCVGQGGSDG